LGKPAEAELLFRQSLKIAERNHSSDWNVSGIFHNLAMALELEGKLPEAEEAWRKRVSTLEKLAAGDGGELQSINTELVAELGNLGRLLQREGKAEQADAVRREALARLERIAESLAKTARPLTPDLLRARAIAFARLGRWREAAADFSRYCEAIPDDDTTWETFAAALVETGGLDAYRRHCRDGFAHFHNTSYPRVADRVAKACLILPDSGVDLRALAAMANKALTLEKGNAGMPWHQFCKALAEYRQGNFADAARWSEQTLSHSTDALAPRIWALNGNSIERDAAAYALLAMAQHQLGRAREAKLALSNGIEIAETEMAKTGLNADLENSVYARALLREAKALIEGEPNK
jgi:tetratricopeptide (TPR) repeat protein